jgi:hypothetical protein
MIRSKHVLKSSLSAVGGREDKENPHINLAIKGKSQGQNVNELSIIIRTRFITILVNRNNGKFKKKLTEEGKISYTRILLPKETQQTCRIALELEMVKEMLSLNCVDHHGPYTNCEHFGKVLALTLQYSTHSP